MTRIAFRLLMAAVVSMGWFFLAVWIVLPVTFVADAMMPIQWEGLIGEVAKLMVYLTTIAAAIQGFFLGMWLLRNE